MWGNPRNFNDEPMRKSKPLMGKTMWHSSRPQKYWPSRSSNIWYLTRESAVFVYKNVFKQMLKISISYVITVPILSNIDK